MKFKKIIEEVAKKFSIDILNHDVDVDIEEVAFVENTTLNNSPHTLYFSYNEIQKLPPQCITIKNAISKTNFNEENIAIIAQDDFFSVFNFVQNLIKDHSEKSFHDDLTEIFQETKDLQFTLDLASAKLNNPLVFIDQTYRIIGHSSRAPISDQLFHRYTQQGYCDFNLIRNQHQFQLLHNMDSVDKIYLDKGCLHSPSKKLFMKISNYGTEYGLVVMLCEQSVITEAHYKNFKTIGKFLSKIANKYIDHKDLQITPYENIMNFLLIGAEVKEITPYLSNLKPSDNVCTIVVAHENEQTKTPTHSDLHHQLKHLFPTIHLITHSNYLVAFFELDQASNISAQDLQVFYDFAQLNSLKIGISNTYTHISDFVEHYQQACAAITLQDRFSTDSTISHYSQYQFYHLLSNIEVSASLEIFRHPAVKRLQEYDSKNNTSLYQTLETLLEHSMSIKDTAKALFIHRNSLNYRIERIKKITHLDLQDSESNFLLRVSFHIDKFTHSGG